MCSVLSCVQLAVAATVTPYVFMWQDLSQQEMWHCMWYSKHPWQL